MTPLGRLIVVALVALLAACEPSAGTSQAPSAEAPESLPSGWAALEMRLSAPGLVPPADSPTTSPAVVLDAGAPLLLEVVVDNLEAVRDVNARGGARPGIDEAGLPAVVLDGEDAWERRVSFDLTGPDGVAALDGYDWSAALLGGAPPAAGRSASFTAQRATWILTPGDLAALPPGDQRIIATLAAPDGSESLVSAPLVVTIAPAPPAQAANALYGQAKAFELRGEWQAALDAARQALDADPALYDAMEVVAKSHLQLGDRAAAIDWYERYIATFADDAARDGYPRILRSLVESLRAQQ